MTINPNFEQFKLEFPKVGEIFSNLYHSIGNEALDEKTKQLVYLGVLTTVRYAPAIRVHVSRALEAGANKDEILGAIMMSIPASGICNFLEVLPHILEILDDH